MTNLIFKYRPHHFLCTVGFKGLGYSPSFVHNYTQVHSILTSENGDAILLEVTYHSDVICAPCPHKRGTSCDTPGLIHQLDSRHGTALNLTAGDQITWGNAKKRIVQNITDTVFHYICDGCSWKDMGMCQQALHDLKKPPP
jgi:hypothetical protein